MLTGLARWYRWGIPVPLTLTRTLDPTALIISHTQSWRRCASRSRCRGTAASAKSWAGHGGSGLLARCDLRRADVGLGSSGSDGCMVPATAELCGAVHNQQTDHSAAAHYRLVHSATVAALRPLSARDHLARLA